ncbi:MAG: aldo/keto reductase [Kiritimatiellales bacterium]
MKQEILSGISKLTLGTVQFGLNYGIANSGGQPEYRTCRDIVAGALEAGINCFDTAAMYGESEKVLGLALTELNAGDKAVLVSKSPPVSEAKIPADEVETFIEKSLRQSLKNLGVDSLPVFLFHRDQDIAWMDALHRMKELGLVQRIGVSVDSLELAGQIFSHSLVDAVQLPHNLFDRRFSSGPYFKALYQRNALLFIRSAFLQGLLLMPEEKIPVALSVVVPVRHKLEEIARTAGMGMPELCLRYNFSFPEITSVLIGVDSVQQLKENVMMLERGPLDAALLDLIHESVPEFPESIIRPSQWSK